MTLLRAARPEEAALISDLALRSKAHWGYDAAFLEACRAELTWTAEQCGSGDVVLAERDGRVVGFYALGVGATPDRGELDACFVEPAVIGSGVGGVLLRGALIEARRRGWRRLALDADPGAEGFYLRHGARRVGEAPSGSLPGRLLPRLEFVLSGSADG
ncbi:GNAT family N-acetyltransferase [Nocardioides sp. BP30]|uniref:GNAT family N-acetyltransferase n=1 Tax=Nocardioides sp. BP30 TaxID=3036374 RepID=UPI0024684850|nr:GNAT family N-acetyltransferase [Nocardioides sp. BP30]WGL53443.1 GNAT family N-acetyltransferase [Nocardioides sp. BP30]